MSVLSPHTTAAELARLGCGVFISCKDCWGDWYVYPQAFPRDWTVARIEGTHHCATCRRRGMAKVLTPAEWARIHVDDRAPKRLKVRMTSFDPIAPGVAFTTRAPAKPSRQLTPVYVRTVADWKNRKWGVRIECTNCSRVTNLDLKKLPDRATAAAIEARSTCTRCHQRGTGKISFTAPNVLRR